MPPPAYTRRSLKQIEFNSTFRRIPPGNLGEFKALAARALEIARDEPGTLSYSWYLDKDETACVVREVYADSDAVLSHIANLGELMSRVLEAGGGCELEMFGEPSPELIEATRALDLSAFTPFQHK
jgi:quinol monooxygenase YgiN